MKEWTVEEGEARNITTNGKTIVKDRTPDNSDASDLRDSGNSDCDDSDDYSPGTDDDNQGREHEAQQDNTC